jgi:type VI secretion system protein ImpG
VFSRYYQSELTYLRELGKEFAAANPSLAGLFADRGGDPDVERLLEGFAFLTSRIRERIDDAVPEVIDAVTQLVVPQMGRTLPSCSVVEFKPNYSALRGVHTIERHTELGTEAIAGTQCRFRTTVPVELLPLELTRCELDRSREKLPRIVLRFQRRGGTAPWPEHGQIPLFIDGPLGLTATLFLWLHQHLREVRLRSNGQEHALPKATVRALGLAPDFDLLPWPDVAPDGLRLAQELFTLPSKLLFVRIEGLGRVPEAAVGSSFDLVLEVAQPPDLPERLDERTFKLHCVPVINLFETSADPVTRDARVHEHLIRAAGMNPRHMEVYSIDSVVGLSSQRQARRRYAPFHAFSHLEANAADRAFYSVRRAPSPIDGATDSYISIVTPADVEPELDEEVLSIDVTCTNRGLTTELRVGDICKPTPRSPTVAKFSNVTEVTRPARPPVGAEMHWRLVSHLALNVHTLTDVTALRALLHHYNLHRESDHQRSRANELRVNALRAVSTVPELRVIDRVPVRGFHTTVEVDEAGYTSVGDAFLFGCAINWVFATETPLNAFHRLSMNVHPLGVTFEWPPTTGSQPVF